MKVLSKRLAAALFSATVLSLPACGGGGSNPSAAAGTPGLVVYSARKEHLIKPLFDRYEAATGVRVRYITDEAGPLLARLQTEGANTPADLLITVDAGNLWHAAEQGVLAPVASAALEENVPAYLRDDKGRWYGLTIRARTIVYSTARVTPQSLGSYADLAGEQWRGRLCLRTSKKVYNQSLVATLIAAEGEAEAEAIVRGWVANLAVPPFANDTMAMEAILAGRCDASLVNSYYFGRLQQQYTEAGKDLPLALFWADAAGHGTHINISGAGVTRHAPNPMAARALLEWLTGVEAQQMLVELNQEYPVNPSAALTPQMESWGELVPDTRPVSDAGRLQAEAVRLMDRAGYR